MPLDSTANSTNTPPTVTININDGGPGTGNDHRVDLYISYQKSFLRLKRRKPAGGSHSPLNATVTWKKVFCQASGKDFVLEFERKKPGNTVVMWSVHDKQLGEIDADKATLR